MKKVVLGAALGIGVIYLAKRLYDTGYMEQLSDNMRLMGMRAKKKAKNALDVGQNEMEYIRERAEFAARKHKKD